jgi:hypothetical protein
MKNLPIYWLSRLLISCEVLIAVVMVSWMEPTSITAKAIEATGAHGWAIIIALGACCLMSIADVIVNDLMPESWHFRSALHWRHMGLFGIAMLLAFLGVLIAAAKGHTPLLYVYWFNAIAAAAMAYLDIFARHAKS